MARLLVVIDRQADWKPFHPSPDVLTAEQYLSMAPMEEPIRVLNLCRSYRYLGTAWYVTLTAEARGQRVIPSLPTLSALSRWELREHGARQFALRVTADQAIADGVKRKQRIYFGQCHDAELADIARFVFEQFPAPVLDLTLVCKSGYWQLKTLKAVGIHKLAESEQNVFAEAMEAYSTALWRLPETRRRYDFDLAILVDPEESLPPSDSPAIEAFIEAAARHRIHAECITRKQMARLDEFDALFIRCTTAVNHYSYRFALAAEQQGLVVIDDPQSILRCTNKVFLTECLQREGIAMPKTRILRKGDQAKWLAVAKELGYPMVLKVPDGAFSIGVEKVSNDDELTTRMVQMGERSSLILAQEFCYTDFDWRIGVLGGRMIYACRYYMVANHWQIYQHAQDHSDSGHWDCIATEDVPEVVAEQALAAASLMGTGLYGVDLKQRGDEALVIEVNDNPSLDWGIEDAFLGTALYDVVMAEFAARLRAR